MSESTNGDQNFNPEGTKEDTKKVQKDKEKDKQDDQQNSGSSSSGSDSQSQGSASESDEEDQKDHGDAEYPNEQSKKDWKEQQQGFQEQVPPQRGNGGVSQQEKFKDFNPKKFNEDGQDEQQDEYQTRDQFRNQGRGRGRGGGYNDRGDRGGYNDRGGRGGGYNDRGDRGDRGGRGGFVDRGGRGGGRGGFSDRGGRGGFSDRGGRGRGGFGGDRNFGDRDNSRGGFRGSRGGFGDRDNDRNGRGGGYNNRSFNDRQSQNSSYNGGNNQNGFNNSQKGSQGQNQFRNSRSGGQNTTQAPINTQFGFQAQQPVFPATGQQQSFPTTGQQPNTAQFQTGTYPANFFPFIATTDPQAAFKKKPGFSEEQKLTSSKVSKMSKATSKRSKKDKKHKKRKHQSSSSDSSSSGSSSDEQGNDSLNMSLFQASNENQDSFIHQLDKLKKKQKEKRNDKKRFQKLEPSGRKDWPSAVLYVLGNTFQITFRQITEHSDCAMVIPYNDLSMNLYPGTIINKSQIDYRQKLEQKKDQLKPGAVYTQDNLLSKDYLYHCLAFVKIDEQQQTVLNALKYIFDTLERLQKKFKQLQNIVIPLSLFSYHTDKYPVFLKKVMSLMESKKFKSVSLTTNNREEWQKAMTSFVSISLDMIKRNEIGI